MDNDDNAVSFVTVVVNKATGNSEFRLIGGTTTDDQGIFKIEDLEDSKYLLTFLFIGFQPENITVQASENMNIGIVKLEKDIQILDETLVVLKNPTIRKDKGKLIFTVEGTSLSTGTALNVLSRTPGVMVFQEQISIKNTTPIIYINNRRVYLSSSEVYSLLNNMDAAIIKSVEVIANPGAQYDAEAGTVLNIITSKAVSVGYKGAVTTNYEQAVYSKYSFGTSHFFKSKWLDLTANYSFSPRKEYKNQDDMIRYFEPDGNVNSLWNVDFNRTTKSYGHQGNLNADFSFNEKNTFSFASNIFVSPNTKFNNDVFAEIRNAAMQLDSTFKTISNLKNKKSNLSFNGTHTLTMDDQGSKLKTSVNYITYNDKQFQEVFSSYFSPSGVLLRTNSFFTNALQESDIVTAQTDAELPGTSGEFSIGFKYSNINTKSSLDFFDTDMNNSQFNPELSDEFMYEESIFAGYTNYSYNEKLWSFNAGIRAEYTDVVGNSLSLGTKNSQYYFELFPSVLIEHTINENDKLGISYARRITRPRYQSLNPFKYFLNENNFTAGNPNLVPAIDTKITLSYSLKNKWFFDLYYHGTDNVLSTLTFQNNINRVIHSIDANLIKDFQYSLDILYSSSITSWWYLSVYTSGFYFENEFYSEESPQETYSNSTFGLYAQMYSGLTLSKVQSLTADITTVYLSDYIYGSYSYGNQLNVSVSLRKKFWNNRASITIGVDDMFDTFNVPIFSKYYNQDNSYFSQPETRLFRLGLRYSFGNIILHDNSRSIKTDESERLEKK